ncbi:hypothetical protein KUTeg_014380 [Tegillarca granosa]|uniref:Uncharacterized protein n=1 Tax=Tegillarca granosa TaxID=220873 RepID=A0ABQ9EZX9_TEGGR|nr:hypothetical protein KUTeg_014380 [Tegillarca granosa]
MAHMQTRVVDLISKRPPLRKDVEIQFVLPWLKKKSERLQTLDNVYINEWMFCSQVVNLSQYEMSISHL